VPPQRMRPVALALLLVVMAGAPASAQVIGESSRLVTVAPERVTDPPAPGAAPSAQAGRRDRLWNGIVIGAALGLLGVFTTAAEAPLDGKVVIVAGAALAGACVDARFDRAPRNAWNGGQPPPAGPAVRYTIRF
jgi:hypothetical protein